MRFYHKIENLVYPHLRLILQDPFQRFGNDIVYFFSCEHETGWKPFNIYEGYHRVTWKAAPRCYTPHPLSPLTNEIRRAMKITIAGLEPKYPEFYAAVVSRCGENKLLQFVAHVNDVIERHFAGQGRVFDIFFTVQHIARMGVFFHQMGTPDAAHMATTLISYLLFREQRTLYDTDVFELLHLYCKNIVDKFEASKNQQKEQQQG